MSFVYDHFFNFLSENSIILLKSNIFRLIFNKKLKKIIYIRLIYFGYYNSILRKKVSISPQCLLEAALFRV